MKKFFTIFFVTLGVIFSVLILIGVYLFVADPYNIKPLFFGSEASITDTSTGGTDKNPALSEKQEKALETFGIDLESVPSSFTPEQESCAIKILGEARVNEIKAGDSPTAAEYFQVKGCL